MPIEIVQVPCLTDNYAVLVHDSSAGLTACIDAPEAAPIAATLRSRGWRLTHLLITHHHGDDDLGTGRGLMARYSGGTVHLLEPYAEGTAVTAGYGNYVDDRTWNGTVQYQHLWTAVSNSVRFGANGFSRDVTTENRSTDVGALWNVSWLNVPSASFGYPLVDVAGYTRVGDAYSLPILRDTKTFQIADDVSFDRGAHLIKVGGEMRSIRLNSRLDLFSRGQLSFSGALTGSGIGDLLLGQIGRAHV